MFLIYDFSPAQPGEDEELARCLLFSLFHNIYLFIEKLDVGENGFCMSHGFVNGGSCCLIYKFHSTRLLIFQMLRCETKTLQIIFPANSRSWLLLLLCSVLDVYAETKALEVSRNVLPPIWYLLVFLSLDGMTVICGTAQ